MEMFEYLCEFFELTEEEMEQLEYNPHGSISELDPEDNIPY